MRFSKSSRFFATRRGSQKLNANTSADGSDCGHVLEGATNVATLNPDQFFRRRDHFVVQ
jgi:hypothetical protein